MIDREELIAQVERILEGIDRTEDDRDGWWETSAGAEFGATRLAEVRAAFDEAHAPVAKCGGAQTNCRHDMHPPMHSAACPVSQAHTPTDDDREALIALGLASHRERMSDGHVSVVMRTNEEAADVALAAGFRRTVQGEPQVTLRHADGSPKSNDEIRAEAAAIRDHVRALTGETDAGLSKLGGFHGEPTDAQVLAALNAWGNDRTAALDDWHSEKVEAMRAALRAAGVVGQGGGKR